MRIRLNCAASLDGRIAAPGGKPVQLSSPEDLRRVHALRADSDGVLVGVGTVLADDPSLLVKAEHLGREPPRQPARIVLDSRGRTPRGARVLDGRAPCFILASETAPDVPGAKVLRTGRDRTDLSTGLALLEARGVRTLLVEGGGHVLASFLREGLWDELTVYVAPVLLGSEGPPLFAADTRVDLPPARVESLGDGTLLAFGRTPP